MIFYTVFALLYVGALLFIKPSPKSFREKSIGFTENFLAIKGSLVLGLLILTVYLFITDFTFLEPNISLYNLLVLHHPSSSDFLISQVFSNTFVHLNMIHLLSNLMLIGLFSAYERRVGLKRFLMVVFVSGVFSTLSILFYDVENTTAGISGVAFGLAAAFFTDEKNLSFKDWVYALLLFIFLAVILSVRDFYEMQKLENIDFQIDYMGHFLGALGAIVYTRLKSLDTD